LNVDGSPKSANTVAYLIQSYARRRAGIVLSPHQFRHLNAKIMLDAHPGAFEDVRQLLAQKSMKTTQIYAGIDRRRAGLHQQKLIEKAIAESARTRVRVKLSPGSSSIGD
jgi:site-specific recombinase XerD